MRKHDVAKAPSGQTLNGFTCTRSKTSGSLVARMERSVIRDRLTPDYAEFIIGPAQGGTRGLHPGYKGGTEIPFARGSRQVAGKARAGPQVCGSGAPGGRAPLKFFVICPFRQPK